MTNPHGQRIQSFVVTPEGDGPFPTVMSIHGGPEWHERDRFDAETQAFVDHGYAVVLVNYRGSTGYGVGFRESLIGNVCFTESDDILATLDACIADGTTDRDRVFWSGWSWGGCLACFNAGVTSRPMARDLRRHPGGGLRGRARGRRAGAPGLGRRRLRRCPGRGAGRIRRSDPMSYVDAVTAPTLIIAGEQDPRCPPEGVDPWVDAVRAQACRSRSCTTRAATMRTPWSSR